MLQKCFSSFCVNFLDYSKRKRVDLFQATKEVLITAGSSLFWGCCCSHTQLGLMITNIILATNLIPFGALRLLSYGDRLYLGIFYTSNSILDRMMFCGDACQQQQQHLCLLCSAAFFNNNGCKKVYCIILQRRNRFLKESVTESFSQWLINSIVVTHFQKTVCSMFYLSPCTAGQKLQW